MRTPLALLTGWLIAAAAPAIALGPEDVSVERVYSGISFAAPLLLTSAPGDADHVYVVLQDGRILRVPRNPDADTAESFLDIRDRVSQLGGERGLLGLAFDPDYAVNGRFYVNYVNDGPPRITVISRFERESGGAAGDKSSETRLLSYAQPFATHNGGWVGIGPDRHLYIASGDGGGAGDPLNNAQRLDTPLGKVLRITRSGDIPASNPFRSTSGARGEVWAYGLRNPFRMAFDSVTGELWAADVGQSTWEEVNVIRRGANYGWRVFEGNQDYNNPDGLPPDGFTPPVHAYTRDEGCSVIGGAVYRGGAIPALNGRFVYTDLCSGTLWALEAVDGNLVENTVIGQIPGNPTSIGEDQDGELFVTTISGEIWRIAPDAGGGDDAAFPQRLSQTGLFADTAALEPAADLIAYDVRLPFWSDRAEKRRWFRLPEGSTIRFRRDVGWLLPVGSVTVKHFDIRMADGRSRRLETRVFRNLERGWRGATYRWNADETDAVLIKTRTTETLQVMSDGGRQVEQVWEYPSPSSCLRCHTSAAGDVLGITTAQLNRKVPGTEDNQLAKFASAGLFEKAISPPDQYPALAQPHDETDSLEHRARAYLHVNCAQCHRPDGPTGVDMDLRWFVWMGKTRTIGVAPTGDDLGIAGAVRVAPGEPERSLVWQRMQRRDAQAMPPVGSHVVHAGAVKLIRDWIAAGAN
jgi:uncharacterized repeat protein (TIGR03806 family)